MVHFSQEDLAKRIIYEDSELCVIHKPAGIAVQSARIGQMDLESALRIYLKNTYLGIIHRLDQPVEGLLVFAKNKKAAENLNRQMREGGFGKRYLAVIEGETKDRETLENFLVKDTKSRLARVVKEGTPQAKRARLSYQLLERDEKSSLVEIFLDTGRFHQIRAQMSHAGMPLLGDRKYNPNTKGERLALCAWKLSFVHPRTKKEMEFALDKDVWKRQFDFI